MDEHICFLITLLYGNQLIKCALKVKANDIDTECAIHPMESECREVLHGLLPLHVRELGPIVNVDEIFEVEVKG